MGYVVAVNAALKSKVGTTTGSYVAVSVGSMMDTTDKFPRISDEALLDSIQYNTFQYFWKYGHPNSGLARERNTSGDLVTSGGSGMGIMAIIAGINRGFVTRAEGLARIQKMASFLKNTAQIFHGAYSHWLDGNTGKVIPFSSDDNGGDLVETSYLIQGLLTARAYFDQSTAAETQLRADATSIWEKVEWDWYTKGNSGSLYWHWSPSLGWKMNMTVRGWNECLITYVLAASSPTHPIDLATYQKGWASNGAMKMAIVTTDSSCPWAKVWADRSSSRITAFWDLTHADSPMPMQITKPKPPTTAKSTTPTAKPIRDSITATRISVGA